MWLTTTLVFVVLSRPGQVPCYYILFSTEML